MALGVEIHEGVHGGSNALRGGVSNLEKEVVRKGDCVECSHGVSCEYGRRIVANGFTLYVK